MFDIPLPIYFFSKEHPLKASNRKTHIPLLINQFVSLIVLKIDELFTAWRVSKYGVISGPYFPAFGLNTERYFVVS